MRDKVKCMAGQARIRGNRSEKHYPNVTISFIAQGRSRAPSDAAGLERYTMPKARLSTVAGLHHTSPLMALSTLAGSTKDSANQRLTASAFAASVHKCYKQPTLRRQARKPVFESNDILLLTRTSRLTQSNPPSGQTRMQMGRRSPSNRRP